jgi:preprotein translocase SecE subunit
MASRARIANRKSENEGIAMTVAVKNTPELSTGNLFDRLAVTSLAGVVYVLGSLAVIFTGLPALWWNYLGLSRESFPAWALLIVAMVAVAGGLIYLGGRLLGPAAPKGARAGIFVGLIGVLIIGWIAKWIAGLIENWSFEHNVFSQTVAIVLTVVVALALLGVLVWFFFKPRFEEFLHTFEDQGWFHAVSYKPSQGLKVRRGTMLGILILAGSGVWSYERSLQSGAENWTVDVPFTGKLQVTNRGDAEKAPGLDVAWGQEVRVLNPGDWPDFRKNELVNQAAVDNANAQLKNGVQIRQGDADRFQPADFISHNPPVVKKEAFQRVQKETPEKIASSEPTLPTTAPVLDRYYARQENKILEDKYVKVTKAGERAPFKANDVVAKTEFNDYVNQQKTKINELEEEAQKLRDSGNALDAKRKEDEATTIQQLLPESAEPAPIEGVIQFQAFTLVPSVRFVMPLLLGALSLWLSWRVVNLPGFADFLIATEAELNKVSWTPRRRLVQDTIVVLVTTLLITFFLLFADLVWSQLLSRVGVLQSGKETSSEVQTGGEDLPW